MKNISKQIRLIFTFFILVLLCIYSFTVFADDNEWIDAMDLSGELELEFIDVEGEGGFSNKDDVPDRLKVKNRSPFVRIDKFVLKPKIEISENVYLKSYLRFESGETYLDKVFATIKLKKYNSKIEIGKNTPYYRPKRRTEVYPILGTAFWKGREIHVEYHGKLNIGSARAFVSVALAQKRPIDDDDVAEDKSFKMLALDDHDIQKEDNKANNFTFGGSLGFSIAGLKIMGYGVVGKLMDNSDTEYLYDDLEHYKNIIDDDQDKFNEKNEESYKAKYGEDDYKNKLKDDFEANEIEDTFYFYAGRVSFNKFGIHFQTELLKAMEGYLGRTGWYAEASYGIKLHNRKDLPFSRIEPFVRFGELLIDKDFVMTDEEVEKEKEDKDLTIRKIRRMPNMPKTWDRQLFVGALLIDILENTKLKLEYYVINELTGGTSEDKSDTTKDNTFLAQFEVKF